MKHITKFQKKNMKLPLVTSNQQLKQKTKISKIDCNRYTPIFTMLKVLITIYKIDNCFIYIYMYIPIKERGLFVYNAFPLF